MSIDSPLTPQPATPADVRAIIREYIVTNFLFGDGSSLEDGASLLEAGALDSTGVMELVAFLEDRFGIAIHDEDLVPENLDSIDRTTRLVTARTAASHVPSSA